MAFGYQHFVLIFSKSGSGDVYKFPIDPDHTKLTKSSATREEWPELSGLRDYGVAVIDNRIYFIGGYDKETDRRTDACKSFNPKTHEWKEHARMTTPRDRFAITTIGRKIIVAGGDRAEEKPTNTSEIYDTETDEWLRAGLMSKCRTRSSACTVGETAYMSGGYLNDKPKDNIWMNEKQQSWTELDDDCPQRLSTPTAKHCMVAYDDKIYFIGGLRRIKKGEKWDSVTSGATEALTVHVKTGVDPEIPIIPRENTGISEDAETDEEEEPSFWQHQDVICPWELQPSLPDMIHPRHGAAAVVLGRRIYVFGGVHAEGGDARTVEYLDTETRTWHEDGRINRGNIGSVDAAVLTFANPDDKDYELLLEKRKSEQSSLADVEATEHRKYGWILW